MNLYLKQFLIIIATFFIILWFQNCDDKKHKRERKTFHEIYKLPLLVSAITGLIINCFGILDMNNNVQVAGKPISSQPSLRRINQEIFTELPDF